MSEQPTTAPSDDPSTKSTTATTTPPTASAKDFAASRDKVFWETTRHLIGEHRFARDPGNKLYYFDGKRYSDEAEEVIKKAATVYIDHRKWEQVWDVRLIDRIVSRCAVHAPLLEEEPSTDRINLSNGVYSRSLNLLTPHDPEWLTTTLIPIDYDPTASSQVWDEFLTSIFPPNSLEIAYEILGSLLIPLTFLQQVIWIKGSGQNGKSVFLNAVMGMLGKENVAQVSIETLNADRFGAVGIYRKLLTIDPDVECRVWSEASVFKKASGGDTIRADRKHKEPIEFLYRGKFLLGGNEFPVARDKTFGFIRRWKIVPFDRAFDLVEKEKVKTPQELLKALLAPKALSGAFNRMLEGLARVIKNQQFSDSDAVADATLEFRQTTDPLYDFFRGLMEGWGDEQFVVHKELHRDQVVWAEEHKYHIRSTQDLAVWIRRNMQGVMVWREIKESVPDGQGNAPLRKTIRGWSVYPSKLLVLERLAAASEGEI